MRRPRLVRPRSGGPQYFPLWRIRPTAIMKILPQQPKPPKLVSNILPNVSNRPVRPHNNLCLVLLISNSGRGRRILGAVLLFLYFLYFLPPRHHPTTGILSARRQL